MFHKVWKNSYRNFSRSTFWRDANKQVSPSTPPPSHESVHYVKTDVVPSKFDKWVLLYSKKYKSAEEIPSRITIDQINNAKSLVRIKIANRMMLFTLLCCAVIIYFGKKKAAEGVTLTGLEIKRQESIRAAARERSQAEAKAKALDQAGAQT